MSSDNNKYTVLYIEDHPANFRLVEQAIGLIDGVNLIGANNPITGLEMMENQNPDLVLLDINLPEMSGFTAMEKISSNDTINHIPVIAISANAMPSDIQKAMKMGFRNYLTKPIVIVDFIDEVKKTLQIS